MNLNGAELLIALLVVAVVVSVIGAYVLHILSKTLIPLLVFCLVSVQYGIWPQFKLGLKRSWWRHWWVFSLYVFAFMILPSSILRISGGNPHWIYYPALIVSSLTLVGVLAFTYREGGLQQLQEEIDAFNVEQGWK